MRSSASQAERLRIPAHRSRSPAHTQIAESLFAPGYTMASVIANEFNEATDSLYVSALIEIGLALFIVTVIVNILAQLLVWTATRGDPARANV